MTAEEILNQFKEIGGDSSLMTCRVPNLLAGAMKILDELAQENEQLYSVAEMIMICNEIVNGQPVQVLFDNIANFENHG